MKQNQTTILASSLLILMSVKMNPAFSHEKQLPQINLESVELQKINIEELFTKKHLNTDYHPIKLEASLTEPINLTLEDVIAKSIENNLNLKIAQQNSKAAKWRFWNSFGNLLPDLSLRASKENREGTFYINSNFQAPIDETVASAGLRLNYRAFNGGTSSFLALSEKYFKEAVDAQEESQYNKTLLDSAAFYIGLIKAQSSLSSALKSLERAKANYDLVKKFFDAGKGTKFDLIQSEAGLARAQQQLISEEAKFRNAEIDLAEHLNLDLSSALHIDTDEIATINIIDENLEIKDFLKQSFKNNPDIEAALKNKKALARQSFATAGAFMPTLDIYFDLAGGGAEISDLFRVTTLGFEARYEIGQGLGVNAVSQAFESKALKEKAVLEYLQEVQRIEKNLRRNYLNFQTSKSLLEASQKEFLAAKEAYTLSQLRYKNGIEIFTNLVSIEADLNAAQLNLINSVSDYNLSQLRLVYDLGTINAKEIIESGI